VFLLNCKGKYSENEICEAVNLCNDRGELNKNSIGWARKPLFNCNLSGRWLRKKKWNYWCVTNDECLFSATISNIDYAGMIFVYFLDFKTKKFIEKTIMTPFGKGCTMPNVVNESLIFKNSSIDIKMLKENNDTHIILSCNDFMGTTLQADMNINYPDGHETLNVVIPWNKNTFQFTSKHECLPTSGSLRVGESNYSFNSENTFACLDFGRGIWPYRVKWNWANASGRINDRTIGLNLGGKWTDNTGMNENAIVIDGKITKISEDIIFEYDTDNFMKPWSIRSLISDSIELKFTPFYERIAKSDLKIIKSEVHQMIGYFSGRIKMYNDEYIDISNLLGCSEDHFGLW
jgi:hypothetical protein